MNSNEDNNNQEIKIENWPQKWNQESPFGGEIWRPSCRVEREGNQESRCSRKGGGWTARLRSPRRSRSRGWKWATRRRSRGPGRRRRWGRRWCSGEGWTCHWTRSLELGPSPWRTSCEDLVLASPPIKLRRHRRICWWRLLSWSSSIMKGSGIKL